MSRSSGSAGRDAGDQPGDLVAAVDRAQRTTPRPCRRRRSTCVTSGARISHQGVEVAAERGGEEPLGHLPLDARVGLVAGAAGVHVLAGAVGELPYGRRGAVEDAGDLGVGVAEDLVQDEHRPLQRGERLQHHQQRHRHRLGAQGRLGGVRHASSVSRGSGSQGPT